MGPASRAGAGPGEESHALAAARWLAHGDALRLNRGRRAHALQAIDYDRLARRESRLHHPQAVDDGTQLHGPVLGLVARAYDQDVAHGLIGADRAVVDEDRLMLMRPEQPQARKQPRREQPITVVEQRAAADGAGGGIQGVVHEDHLALVRIAALVGGPHLRGVAAALCSIARELGVLEIDLLIPVKAHVDRIERHQRREERLSIGHEIAAGDERAADTPGDWRGHAREVEIQRCGIERGLRGFHVRLPLLEPGSAGVELLLRDGMLSEEPGRPVALGARQYQLRARLGELGAGLVALGNVRPRIDDEQDVAFFDFAAVLEVDRGDVAGDARPDLDALYRLEAPGELIELRDLARDRGSDRHLRQGRHRLLLGCLIPGAATQCGRRDTAEQYKRYRERMTHGLLPSVVVL